MDTVGFILQSETLLKIESRTQKNPQKLQFLKWSLEAGYKNFLYNNCKGDSFLYHLLKAFSYEC